MSGHGVCSSGFRTWKPVGLTGIAGGCWPARLTDLMFLNGWIEFECHRVYRGRCVMITPLAVAMFAWICVCCCYPGYSALSLQNEATKTCT